MSSMMPKLSEIIVFKIYSTTGSNPCYNVTGERQNTTREEKCNFSFSYENTGFPKLSSDGTAFQLPKNCKIV